jgi:UDP-glucose 4-epimerase
MNLVITGASGFLGSYVINQCASFGFTPIVLKRVGSKKEWDTGKGCVIVKCDDLENNETINLLIKYRPKSFLNLAWWGVDSNTRDNPQQVSYNIPYTLGTVKLANRIGCQQWVGIGSLSEYGQTVSKVDEKYNPLPVTIYGKTKLASAWATEALCQSYGMKSAWLRLGSIYGPGDADHWLIPSVIRSFMQGIPPELTPSEQICDYLYAGDAAEAILNVVKNQLDGIYNIGSGNGVSVKEIVTEIKNKINTNLKIKFGAKPYSSNQIMHMEANIQKIKVFTGWVPTTSFSNGISRTVDSIIN